MMEHGQKSPLRRDEKKKTWENNDGLKGMRGREWGITRREKNVTSTTMGSGGYPLVGRELPTIKIPNHTYYSQISSIVYYIEHLVPHFLPFPYSFYPPLPPSSLISDLEHFCFRVLYSNRLLHFSSLNMSESLWHIAWVPWLFWFWHHEAAVLFSP